MKVRRILLGAFFVGILSVLYNFIVFYVFNFYPDLALDIGFLDNFVYGYYLVIFVKNFIVGLILIILFNFAYRNIINDTGEWKYTAGGIVFFIMYALVAFISFSFGDMLLMRTTEGMLILLTLDGLIETIIATIPIRFISIDNKT